MATGLNDVKVQMTYVMVKNTLIQHPSKTADWLLKIYPLYCAVRSRVVMAITKLHPTFRAMSVYYNI